MDELIQRVTAAAGISEDEARSAVTTVLGFVKERLPASIAGEVDNVIGDASGMAGDLANNIGDLASKVGGAISGK